MGVGLVSKYRFLTEDLALGLIDDIDNQISKYLPELQCTNVEIAYSLEKTAIIKITIDDIIYTLDTAALNAPITLKTFTN